MPNLLTLLLVAVAVAGSGCVSVDLQALFSPPLQETVVVEARTDDKILLIDINGIISSGEPNGRFSLVTQTTPARIRAILDKAQGDDDIKAVVLRIDSPGGGVTASDLIHHELARYHAETGVPVLASIMGLGASGAYYIACAADEIYVQPTSVVGSIGVIAVFPKLRKMADKVGYEQRVFKSGEMKDLGSVLSDMTPEERAVVQGIVDSMYERFLAVVVASRPGLDDARLRPLADGRVYPAAAAVEHGLVDGIVYLDAVFDRARERAGVDKAQVVQYVYGAGDNATIYSSSSARPLPQVGGVQVDLGLLDPSGQLGFLYLWSPGSR